MRPEGRPFDVLPHLRDGICAATPLVEARTYGLITQQHYRSATDPAPPPAPDTRCAPGFPRKRWRDNKGGSEGGDKISVKRAALYLSSCGRDRRFQHLSRALREGQVLEIAREGIGLSTFPGRFPLPPAKSRRPLACHDAAGIMVQALAHTRSVLPGPVRKQPRPRRMQRSPNRLSRTTRQQTNDRAAHAARTAFGSAIS
jgi:hypothetical protein